MIQMPGLSALSRRLFGTQAGKGPAPAIHGGPITLADISERPDPSVLPWIDRPGIDESILTADQAAWRRDGVVIKPAYFPEALIDAYAERRARLGNPAGWQSPTPYLHVPELRDLALYPPMMQLMESLIGEEMMLHLALTGWVSTERTWHQDDYLNPPHVNSWYCAIWIALADIHPDSGPFEYLPGSQAWPLMRRDKVRSFLTEEELARREGPLGVNFWERYSERFVTPAIDAEIERTGIRTEVYLPKKGDLLIWHGRLMHRGSMAKVHWMERRSLICHYSGVNHRGDMPERRRENGQTYAWFDHALPE